MKRSRMLLLALLSALLLSIPFFRWGSGWFLFLAFVPLLFIEEEFTRRWKEGRERMQNPSGRSRRKLHKGSVSWYTLLTFGLWVLATTYWVYWATWVGIVASVIVHCFYMGLTFWLFHYTRRRLGNRLGYASLVIYWLTFEFLYIRATVNFPWLILGYGFANDVMLIQWYEYTGALGGSLWVLTGNLLLFRLVKAWRSAELPLSLSRGERFREKLNLVRGRLGLALAFLLIPAAFSMFRFISYEEKNDPYEMVVLQPNIDPWLKFTDMSQEEQTAYLLQLADSLVTPSTDYIVGPETFINNSVWESLIPRHPEFIKLRRFLADYPKAKLVMGATTYKLYRDPSQFTESSRPYGDTGFQFDHHNTAFQLDSTSHIPLYHKSRLVVGVEHMPYTRLLGFLEGLTVRLGGTFRSNGTQAYRETFVSPQDSTRVAPVICWESVFGEYVTEYVREQGAHFLFIITNDGWWKNTPGHRQHNAYARLRAIETRRSVARSANTGISSLIDQRGVELARIGWWERSGIRGQLNKNDELTFYVKHGDYLGRVAVFLTVVFLLYALFNRMIMRKS